MTTNQETSERVPEAGTAPPPARNHRVWTWVNWALAVLTAPAAALVMVFSIGAVMSTAACSTVECPNMGPNGFVFALMYYGPPVVAGATILASFVTARRRWGIIVPLCCFGLLVLDVVAMTIAFSH